MQDMHKIDRRIEEAILTITPKDPEEQIPEDDKIHVTLKAKYIHTTNTFYAPKLADQHHLKLTKLQSEKQKTGFDRSQMGSKASTRDTMRAQANSYEKYYPMHPEQWKKQIMEFRKDYVPKYQRIWQTLFYLLRYKTREEICERDTNCLSWKVAKNLIND